MLAGKIHRSMFWNFWSVRFFKIRNQKAPNKKSHPFLGGSFSYKCRVTMSRLLYIMFLICCVERSNSSARRSYVMPSHKRLFSTARFLSCSIHSSITCSISDLDFSIETPSVPSLFFYLFNVCAVSRLCTDPSAWYQHPDVVSYDLDILACYPGPVPQRSGCCCVLLRV